MTTASRIEQWHRDQAQAAQAAYESAVACLPNAVSSSDRNRMLKRADYSARQAKLHTEFADALRELLP